MDTAALSGGSILRGRLTPCTALYAISVRQARGLPVG